MGPANMLPRMNVDPPSPAARIDDTAEAVRGADIPLVVDLDGTLCRTDTLQEVVLGLVSRDPGIVLSLPRWLLAGRQTLKARLADRWVVPGDGLPLNEEVLDLVRAARAEGRRTALISAADQRQVAAVAEATGLFDESHGSTETTNLKGAEKARFTAERFGEKGFDYVGDARADLPVWQAARQAITVGAGAGLARAVEAVNPNARHLAPRHDRVQAMRKALRPHQWSKNLLLFLPLLAAHDVSALLPVVMGVIAFSLTASAVYVINDLLDLAADRAHPRKRERPFAAGALTGLEGVTMAGALLVAALAFAAPTGAPQLLFSLAIYFAATLTYSLWLKRKLIADVLALAGLYTIRIVAGGAAAAIDLSPWMLAFSMFLFLALAAVKRQAELADLLATGRAGAGRAYTVEDLPVIRSVAISSGQASVLVLALYIASDDVQRLYAYPALLWLICPLLLYWVLRMVMKTHRGQMTDDPIVFAVTDKLSFVTILSATLIGFAAAVWPWAVVAV